jgi:hypothetical protein
MRPELHVIVAFASALTLIGIWGFQITRRLRRVMAHLQADGARPGTS